ncbi:MAG TPA: hypothetical protein VNX29_10915 [Kaistia sp.]|nr:hypothetical protein [Kaistia sp.]
MRIAMIGPGFGGLVSGACNADFGHDAIRIDKDCEEIDILGRGVDRVRTLDPVRMLAAEMLYDGVEFRGNTDNAAADADGLAIAIESDASRAPGLRLRETVINKPAVRLFRGPDRSAPVLYEEWGHASVGHSGTGSVHSLAMAAE